MVKISVQQMLCAVERKSSPLVCDVAEWMQKWANCSGGRRQTAGNEHLSDAGSDAGDDEPAPASGLCQLCEELGMDTDNREFVSAGVAAGISVRCAVFRISMLAALETFRLV